MNSIVMMNRDKAETIKTITIEDAETVLGEVSLDGEFKKVFISASNAGSVWSTLEWCNSSGRTYRQVFNTGDQIDIIYGEVIDGFLVRTFYSRTDLDYRSANSNIKEWQEDGLSGFAWMATFPVGTVITIKGVRA